MNNDTSRNCGLDSLVEVLGGNRGVAQRLARMFLETYGSTLARLDSAVAAGDWTAGGAALARIRAVVGINLLLGTAIVVAVLLW